MSNSRKVLLSKRRESRSRAVREPRVCCFEMRDPPPPIKARVRSCERRWRKAALTVLGSFSIAVLVVLVLRCLVAWKMHPLIVFACASSCERMVLLNRN